MAKEYSTIAENDIAKKILGLKLEEQDGIKKLSHLKPLFAPENSEQEDVSKRSLSVKEVLKRQRADKLGELQELAESFKKIINELGSMMTTIPDQSEHIYQELKDFNLDVE